MVIDGERVEVDNVDSDEERSEETEECSDDASFVESDSEENENELAEAAMAEILMGLGKRSMLKTWSETKKTVAAKK